MKSLTILSFLVIATFGIQINGKVFNKCSLARELHRQGFPMDKLRDWVCLVKAESSYRTRVIGKLNKNGTKDYGLFQINNGYWCSNGHPGKMCNVSCENLLTDDITVASKCAKKIYHQQGFKAWYGWQYHCKGKHLPSIEECF